MNQKYFLEYFKTLHNPSNNSRFDKNFADTIKEKNKKFHIKIWSNTLDKSISQKEIRDATKLLKNKNACGLDMISNKMIKYSINNMVAILLKMFNKIIQCEFFLSSWGKGYI